MEAMDLLSATPAIDQPATRPHCPDVTVVVQGSNVSPSPDNSYFYLPKTALFWYY